MENVHYNLDQIERDTRKMFHDFKPDTPEGVFLKESVDVQVAFTRQILIGIMAQTPPDNLFNGAAYVIAELMLNMTNHFSGAPRELVMERLMAEIANQIEFSISRGDAAIRHTVNVNPMPAGRA